MYLNYTALLLWRYIAPHCAMFALYLHCNCLQCIWTALLFCCVVVSHCICIKMHFCCDCTALHCAIGLNFSAIFGIPSPHCTVFALYLHCTGLHCIWTAIPYCCVIALHCAALLKFNPIAVQSLAFHPLIVSGQCPGSPWPRTPFAFKKRISLFLYKQIHT